jgi:hypothetical protein
MRFLYMCINAFQIKFILYKIVYFNINICLTLTRIIKFNVYIYIYVYVMDVLYIYMYVYIYLYPMGIQKFNVQFHVNELYLLWMAYISNMFPLYFLRI